MQKLFVALNFLRNSLKIESNTTFLTKFATLTMLIFISLTFIVILNAFIRETDSDAIPWMRSRYFSLNQIKYNANPQRLIATNISLVLFRIMFQRYDNYAMKFNFYIRYQNDRSNGQQMKCTLSCLIGFIVYFIMQFYNYNVDNLAYLFQLSRVFPSQLVSVTWNFFSLINSVSSAKIKIKLSINQNLV